MLVIAAIKNLFYHPETTEILLYFFAGNILPIAVLLSIFYVVSKAYPQLQQKKRLQAGFRNSDNNGLL